MAVLEIEFDSKTLKRTVSFRAVVPYEEYQPPYPTLYLLHGLSNNSGWWLHYTNIRALAEQNGVAVIMPNGENSFYLDILVEDGCLGDFGAYVGEELLNVTRELLPLSWKREETYIAGFSMGGYGALRNGLKYNNFGKIAVFAGAVHFYEYSREWVKQNGNVLGELANFGILDETERTDRNPRVLINQISQQEKKSNTNLFPEIYITCGDEDGLFTANENLKNALEEVGAKVTYEPVRGKHDDIFCNKKLPDVIKWLDPHTKPRS